MSAFCFIYMDLSYRSFSNLGMQRSHKAPKVGAEPTTSTWTPVRCLLGYKRLTPPSAERVTIRSASNTLDNIGQKSYDCLMPPWRNW